MDSNGTEKYQVPHFVRSKLSNEKSEDTSNSCCKSTTINAKVNIKQEQWPEVQLREKKPQDKSAAQRKRNSRNRLSNRRSTGFVTPEEIDAALTFHETENL